MRQPYLPTRVTPPTTLTAVEIKALLQECFVLFRTKLRDMVTLSIGHTNDLFEFSTVSEADAALFLAKRNEWLARFDKSLVYLFNRRLRGERRRGRRPDADASFESGVAPNSEASLESMALLSPVDYAKQMSLIKASRALIHITKKENLALDARIEVLLGIESGQDVDNPFGAVYVLDAIGSTSRAVYPNQQVWRPLMERTVADMTWSIRNLYVALNRLLADRGILPEIKAVLRARSEHRPKDDRELLSKFTSMMENAGLSPAMDVEPELMDDQAAAPEVVFAETAVAANSGAKPAKDDPATGRAARNTLSTPSILAGISALAKPDAPGTTARTGDPHALPDVDPMMTLGASAPLFASLAQLQRHDLPAAILRSAPQSAGDQAAVVPLNLIPHIRAATASQIANPADRITMDVIGLLFDYIFRDPSIPQPLRQLFSRLQVPIVKAVLLDRVFFSDKGHPARTLLDHLAEAAVGADDDRDYGRAFRELATEVVEEIGRDFDTDVNVFTRADQRLVDFIESERAHLKDALLQHIQHAERAESGEVERAEVRVIIRERLAGLSVPFNVHSFVETTWADYLVTLRKRDGADSAAYREALEAVDKLLWSIVAKERTAQKMRLAKMIPKLIVSLRQGLTTQNVPPDRSRPFLDEIYELHVAAIKPRPADSAAGPQAAAPAVAESREVNVHDFVADMVIGTWLSFIIDGEPLTAHLAWISPKRGRFIFTRHTPARVLSFTAEELAYELGTGRAKLIVETVPLFDRVVSKALDNLAAKAPAPGVLAVV